MDVRQSLAIAALLLLGCLSGCAAVQAALDVMQGEEVNSDDYQLSKQASRH
jgi:hypothetical protein